jgi:hypothetical protein
VGRRTTIGLLIAAQALILIALLMWGMYRIIAAFHADGS